MQHLKGVAVRVLEPGGDERSVAPGDPRSSWTRSSTAYALNTFVSVNMAFS